MFSVNDVSDIPTFIHQSKECPNVLSHDIGTNNFPFLVEGWSDLLYIVRTTTRSETRMQNRSDETNPHCWYKFISLLSLIPRHFVVEDERTILGAKRIYHLHTGMVATSITQKNVRRKPRPLLIENAETLSFPIKISADMDQGADSRIDIAI